MHAGQGPGLTNRKQGTAGGGEQVTLTSGQMPSHSHAVGCTATAGNQPSPVGNIVGSELAGAADVYGAPLHDAIAVWDPKNYPGSGPVLPDPIGGFNMTIDGSPTFNAGLTPFFTMDGVNDRIWHADIAGLELADGGAKTLLISCHLRGGANAQLIGKANDISGSGAFYGVRNQALSVSARARGSSRSIWLRGR